jgi:cytosine/adenosine deaminase-related metal-dependent hydrolase
MSSKVLVRGGLIVTMNPTRTVVEGDVTIEDGILRSVGDRIPDTHGFDRVIDARDQFVIPGLIQAHTHLCQTLFRGQADDLALLDWLRLRIWPMENAHTPSSIRASARIGCLEMQTSGTTAILDMGTVRHTYHLLQAVRETGIRYCGGKCLMDHREHSGPLYEPTAEAIRETEELVQEWRNKHPLIRYALCPRFVVSCTEEILEAVAGWQKQLGLVVHTHASENRDEVELVRQRTGRANVDYLDDVRLLGRRTVIAHGIHVSEGEIRKLARAGSSVVHCPSSNLKLGSGIARIHQYLQKKVNVALGADGAPCNNMMDPFVEMRLAALLQKPLEDPRALPAPQALELATLGGARALGMEDQLGSLEPGKLADVVTVDRSHPSVATVRDPYSALVYSCTGRDVRHVLVGGELVVHNGRHQKLDRQAVIEEARQELEALLRRM